MAWTCRQCEDDSWVCGDEDDDLCGGGGGGGMDQPAPSGPPPGHWIKLGVIENDSLGGKIRVKLCFGDDLRPRIWIKKVNPKDPSE